MARVKLLLGPHFLFTFTPVHRRARSLADSIEVGRPDGIAMESDAMEPEGTDAMEEAIMLLDSASGDDRHAGLMLLLDLCDQAFGEAGVSLGDAARAGEGRCLRLVCSSTHQGEPEESRQHALLRFAHGQYRSPPWL